MRREAANHSVGGHVRGMARPHGMESSRSMRKRGRHGTFQHFSPKHRRRRVNEFAVRSDGMILPERMRVGERNRRDA